MVKRSHRIIEIAGLPGTGKTTVCKILSLRHGSKSQSIASLCVDFLKKYYVSLLLLPFTVIYFRKVLRVVYYSDVNRTLNLYPLWVVDLLVKAVGLRKFEMGNKVSQEILQKLNSFLFRNLTASIESVLRNKSVVIDEGFIQTGLGIWMRTPAEWNQQIWETYKSYFSSSSWSVIVFCGVGESLRRSEERGLRPVLISLKNSNQSSDWLNEKYVEMTEMLRVVSAEGRASSVIVEDNASPNTVAVTLIRELQSLINGQKIIWWTKS